MYEATTCERNPPYASQTGMYMQRKIEDHLAALGNHSYIMDCVVSEHSIIGLLWVFS